MHEGFYAIAFQAQGASGSGVVYLNDGQVRGGDSILYYLGKYTLDGDNFTAEITTNAHANMPGMRPLFGQENVHITLQGSFAGQNAKLTGTAKEAPTIKLTASLKMIGT